MDMISFNSLNNENVGFYDFPVSVKKQAEAENKTVSGENGISDVDCFKELCKRFPNASFAVEDISLECTDQEWLPEKFLGNSNLKNFSSLGTVSIAFDKKIFEKAANDPVFMEHLIGFTENLNNKWEVLKEGCLSDGMKYMHADVFLEADGTIGYNIMEYKAPFRLFDLYFEHENSLSGLQADNIAKHILEEYEKQKQEGLFAMMDRIHENFKELNEKIEHDKRHEELIMKEYEKTFLFSV
ncbi:MAG: hypothetical protein HFH68_00825 [Lachnospiraceae bacterium]|nr:hypothetical protein [Lachnospiraceae bacterium]